MHHGSCAQMMQFGATTRKGVHPLDTSLVASSSRPAPSAGRHVRITGEDLWRNLF